MDAIIEAQDDLNAFNAEFDEMMARNRYANWLADNGLTEEQHEQICSDWCDAQD